MRRAFSALAAVALGAGLAGGQSVRAADSLLRRGMLDRAEAEYYAAARARPRDPDARFALGRFLASRGAFRIGATLLDEAMQFGYDKRAAGAALAALYMDMGEYSSLERLPVSPLTAGEREQVQWLVAHPSKVQAPDSTVLAAFARASGDGFLGALRMRIDGRPVVAMVSPRSGCGVRLADTSAIVRRLHRFPSGGGGASRSTPAAADSIGFGRMTITNVPVRVETLRDGVEAIVCFGLLDRYAPTFDARAGLVTLHLAGIAPPAATASTVFPILNVDGQYAVPEGGGWAPIVLPQVSSMLRDRRWTFDPRRGQLAIDP